MANGHIDLSRNNFISYAYQPDGSTWGNWPTFLDPISLATTTRGLPVWGQVSSIVAGSPGWSWSGPRAWDGDAQTDFPAFHTAPATPVSNGSTWISGKSIRSPGCSVQPRQNGYGFPVDYTIETSLDASTWAGVPGETFTGFPNPGDNAVNCQFGGAASARYLKLRATRFGTDDHGDHYLQLAELTPVISP